MRFSASRNERYRRGVLVFASRQWVILGELPSLVRLQKCRGQVYWKTTGDSYMACAEAHDFYLCRVVCSWTSSVYIWASHFILSSKRPRIFISNSCECSVTAESLCWMSWIFVHSAHLLSFVVLDKNFFLFVAVGISCWRKRGRNYQLPRLKLCVPTNIAVKRSFRQRSVLPGEPSQSVLGDVCRCFRRASPFQAEYSRSWTNTTCKESLNSSLFGMFLLFDL